MTAETICVDNVKENMNLTESCGYFMEPWRREWLLFLKNECDSYLGRLFNRSMCFYDSIAGKPVFRAPVNRTMWNFMDESFDNHHLSFRDAEVIWDNVREMPNGQLQSKTGTHLGHTTTDQKGKRYTVNLVSVAGYPTNDTEALNHIEKFEKKLHEPTYEEAKSGFD